jgi:hypothetical protein
MTVPASTRRSSVYDGNDSATSFAFAFKVFADTDIAVYITAADGTVTTGVLDSDYSVTLNGDQSVSPGGSVTYPLSGDPLPTGDTLVIVGALPYTQTLAIPGGGNFNPVALENALDRLEMQIQQLADGGAGGNASTLRVPTGETIPAFGSAATRASKLMSFDADGDPQAVAPVDGTAASLAISLAAATLISQGAGQIGYSAALAYPAGTVGDALNDAGVPITAFGAVMDSSGAAQRTANSAALLAASAASKKVIIPIGTLWVDPNIEVPVDLQLEGKSKQLSKIKGDGDLFKITQAAFGIPSFRNLTIANDVTRGKLIRTAVGADIGRVTFEHVDFGKATHHIYAADLCVDWLLIGCRFTDASVHSRSFPAGLWAHNEIACYTWSNAVGLFVGKNSSSCNIDGVLELNTSYGIHLLADDVASEIGGWSIRCHFEFNGSAAGAADVMLETSAATRIRAIDFSGSRFSTPDASQTIRVNQALGGAGNADQINFGPGVVVMGAAELCADSNAYTVDRAVYFQALDPRDTNRVPLTAQSQFSKHLGAYQAAGISDGSGVTLHSITPPTGAKFAQIFVQGNIYNAVADSHDGILTALWRASGGRITTYTDTNHSAGANQGWVASWSGTQIVIANKAALTNNQSGDVTVVFYG